MSKKLPKISIVIPTYNAERYLEETLESIFSQNYPNLEVWVQDGGSTDKTLLIIKKFSQKYTQIKWVSQKDKGQLDAINKGLEKVTGEILTYINADDVYQKGALLAVGEYFARYPNTFWLAGKGDIVNEEGKVKNSWVTGYKNFLLKINNYKLLLLVNYLVQPAVFLSQKAFRKFGPFTGEGRIVMEYALWLKIARLQMPAVLPRYLASFRLTAGNLSSTQFQKLLYADYQIVKKYTANPILLFLHRLHNWLRILLVSI
jgi:glycosyltransferase involved in cell wall biosynthesis